MLFRQNMPKLQSKIRFLHAIPSMPAVDVYLSGSLFGKNVAFSDITCYENISPGNYELQLYKTGTYDKPLMSKEVDILPKSNLTVNLVALGGKLDILKLNDATGKGGLANSFLRFINLSPNSPLLTLSLPNDIPLFNSVEYLETTGYYALSPAIYDFKVSFSSLAGLYKFISTKTLTNGKFYTIYMIGLLNKQPELGYLMVEDGI